VIKLYGSGSNDVNGNQNWHVREFGGKEDTATFTPFLGPGIVWSLMVIRKIIHVDMELSTLQWSSEMTPN
jgi:hypothetical protein